MTTITAPPLPPDDPALDLDARIRLAEQRVTARDAAFRERLSQAGMRLSQATRPRNFVVPVAGAALAVVALVWMVRGGRHEKAAAPAPRTRVAVDGSAEVPWMALLGLLWPLLPRGWRNSVSPATATTAMTVGLPLLQRALLGDTHRPLTTVEQVNLPRFAGTWHEIARLPAPFEGGCDGQPTATYRLRGPATLKVINRCVKNGRMVTSTGVARVEPGSGGARLQVSLWPAFLRMLPIAWAKLWILHVDAGYETALVGHPNRRFLWILSRTPTLAPARLRELEQIAAARGFPVERLRHVQPRPG
jgi:apolipoprotein D and lipocalin family protein